MTLYLTNVYLKMIKFYKPIDKKMKIGIIKNDKSQQKKYKEEKVKWRILLRNKRVLP